VPIIIKKLNGKIVVSNKNNLNDAEIKQINFWNPNTIGEVLFNFWD
jgi:hypothetical protein